MLEYKKALVLAPMVRISELPMRLLSLKYSADLVWGPELIDKKIVQTRRIVNEKLNTIDFRTPDERLVFRTAPIEKSKLVFQMGTADPELAVKAASVVAKDVAAIDVNSGCPKHFSVHSGMGAALLRTPDKLEAILRALVTQVGEPNNIAISVKIRILENAEDTYTLVKRLVKTGISCLTVHCRTTDMRPREDPIYDYLKEIASICHDAGVPCLVNGSILSRDQLQEFMDEYGVDGCMIARAAEANPSCFAGSKLVSLGDIARDFLDKCREYEYPSAHAKYWLMKSVNGKDKGYQSISRSKTLDDLQKAVEVRWPIDTRESEGQSQPSPEQNATKENGDTQKQTSYVNESTAEPSAKPAAAEPTATTTASPTSPPGSPQPKRQKV